MRMATQWRACRSPRGALRDSEGGHRLPGATARRSEAGAVTPGRGERHDRLADQGLQLRRRGPRRVDEVDLVVVQPPAVERVAALAEKAYRCAMVGPSAPRGQRCRTRAASPSANSSSRSRASADRRGEDEAVAAFASWLGSFWDDGPPEPAGPPAAVSPHGAGGRGIRGHGADGAVVGYVPGVARP